MWMYTVLWRDAGGEVLSMDASHKARDEFQLQQNMMHVIKFPYPNAE